MKKINKLSNIKDSSAIIVGASPVEKLPIVAVYGITKIDLLTIN